jgi:hypothetical protein
MERLHSLPWVECDSELITWLDWIKDELPKGGIGFHGEDTALLVAVKSIHFAQRLHRIYGHLPGSLKTLLVQAAILHQWWITNAENSSLRKAHQFPVVESSKYLKRLGENSFLVQSLDSRTWEITFARSDLGASIASEVFTTEVARMIGLPTRELAIISVNRHLATGMGIAGKGWPRYFSRDSSFRCLGRLHNADRIEERRSAIRANPKVTRLLCGILSLDILMQSSVERSDSHSILTNGEPLFPYKGSLMNGNWNSFIRSDDYQSVNSQLSSIVTSSQQLETWIRRIRNVDFDRLWKIAFDMPPEWYGDQRSLMARTLLKLEERTTNLHQIIRALIHKGCFPNISRDPAEGNHPLSFGLNLEVAS